MNRLRSLAMVGGTVCIALGAGQYMQSGSAESGAAMAPVATVEAMTVAPELRRAAATPLAAHEPVIPVAVTRAETVPEPVLAPPAPAADTSSCPVTLDLFADADAMLALTLTAPCHPNEGVVLRHAGLSVTYQTTATGALFVDIPALDPAGEIVLRLADGTEVTATAEVPELAGMRRLALQWIDGDTFALATDAPVVALGADATALPMYALVATLPAPDTPLAIETPVTDIACGREALGAVYFSDGGKVSEAELTIALPDCDSKGGFVVLNNPVAEMKLAAAD